MTGRVVLLDTDPAVLTAKSLVLWQIIGDMTRDYLHAWSIARVLVIGTAARTAGITVIFVEVAL